MINPDAIVEMRVYPPIGIARVGNAMDVDDYVIGPEVVGGSPSLPDGLPARYLEHFRTPEGAIKRHAARFRTYAHMRDGSVQEVTSASARIEWQVAVANLKAGWYEFDQAMDLSPELNKNALRRNRNLAGTMGRQRLDIVPTPQSIEGTNSGPVALDDGVFWTKPVYLGELRTDAEGRLLFLGGRGVSRPFRKGLNPLTFANNTGWHDDVCDGPVRATITFPGHPPMEAEPGYVVVTPPNYAPGLFGVVTMDDAVREVFQNQRWIPIPAASSFTSDIWPIFDRLTGLQWVNHGFFIVHGFGSPLDARAPAVIAQLNDNTQTNAAWRKKVVMLFRDPEKRDALEPSLIPQIFGDEIDYPNNALAQFVVTKTQYAHLLRWAAGSFSPDWPGAIPDLDDFATLEPKQQIEQLERAALHTCLGGPFHPGIELTWVMRIPKLWKSAYRLKVLSGDQPARQNYGDTLTPTVCTGSGGPYDGVARGALTRFLGVPWQTDGTSCNSAADYSPSTFLSMPTFWGARAPDQVLATGNYARAAAVVDGMPFQAHKHLLHRVDWLRDIRGFDYYDRLAKMVEEWAELGMVLPISGAVSGMPAAEMHIEQGRADSGKLIDDVNDPKFHLAEDVESLSVISSPLGGAGPPARSEPRIVAPPPKRVYRQGEI